MKTFIVTLLFINAGFTMLAAAGQAYCSSVAAALHCTRGPGGYPGSGYSDSKAAAEDAHYHEDPSRYDGSQDGRPVR